MCPEVRKGVTTIAKTYLEQYSEVVLRTDLPHQFDSMYVDNSMTVQKRQIISYDEAIKLNLTMPDATQNTANGLNGFPMIDGSAYLSGDSIYAFASSHSLLINVRNMSEFEIMIIWNTNYYDDKGITNPMTDRNIETYKQIHFIANSPYEYMKWRTI